MVSFVKTTQDQEERNFFIQLAQGTFLQSIGAKTAEYLPNLPIRDLMLLAWDQTHPAPALSKKLSKLTSACLECCLPLAQESVLKGNDERIDQAMEMHFKEWLHPLDEEQTTFLNAHYKMILGTAFRCALKKEEIPLLGSHKGPIAKRLKELEEALYQIRKTLMEEARKTEKSSV